MLTLNNISKYFDNKQVLSEMSLTINEGEFIVLVGPSGCGKSTLLRILAGLETASHGEIIFDGQNITDTSPRTREFSMIFQNYALFPHLSVRDNILFGMRIRKEPKANWQPKLDRVAATLELDHLLERKPSQLSGGQRQRVAMARAIIRDPRMFLMDEPLSNLDARLRTEVRDSIMALHQQLKTTTIYVTHDQVEAMSMADKIVVMKDGQIQQIGRPEALYATPRNLFVAGFIGSPSMNIVRVDYPKALLLFKSHAHPTAQHYLEHQPCNAYLRSSPSTEVFIGIRPEHITDRPSGDEHYVTLASTVVKRELLGADYLIHVTTALGTLRYTRENRGPAPQLGDAITLSFLPSDIHYFDITTQRAITKDSIDV